MKRLLAAALVAVAASPASGRAQFREGEATIGVIGQRDIHLISGVRLSPIGVNIGFIVQPMFGSRRASIVEQISFFPITHYEKQTNPFGAPFTARTNPLILNTLWLRLTSKNPEISGETMFFAGTGIGIAVSTPRDGHKVTPMLSLGVRRWMQRQVGVELAIQCGLQALGRTRCMLPLTTAWPF